MCNLPTDLSRRVDQIAADRESGASEILDAVVAVLRDALIGDVPLEPLGRALIRAQPTMAPVYAAVARALAARQQPDHFERFVQQVARAPRALATHGAELLTAGLPAASSLHVVTLSFSRSVTHVLEAVRRRQRALRVSCAEGRPALEGQRLASHLAQAGIDVAFYADAALGHALETADAVLVGADAVAPGWFLNKSGTRMLAAAAGQQGVPVYVVASRDKFVSQDVGARLVVRDGATAEVWDAPPAGVSVRNPYFEPTPFDLVAAVITDMGVLGAAVVPDACRAAGTDAVLAILDDGS